jgi:hypothetical protein
MRKARVLPKFHSHDGNIGCIVILWDKWRVITHDGITHDSKSFTDAQKKTRKKHHNVREILVNVILHSEFVKITDKSTVKNFGLSLCYL